MSVISSLGSLTQAINTSTTGLNGAQSSLNITGNNLANINTTGFKTESVEFQDLFYQTGIAPYTSASGAGSPTGLQYGLGVSLGSTSGIFTQGTVTPTGIPSDVAIQGNGFFQLTQPSGGIVYSRDGTFQMNSSGQLIDAQGDLLTPTITIPPTATSYAIAGNGTVTAMIGGKTVPIGQITLANFTNPAGLIRIGNNLFQASAASGAPQVGTPGTNGLGTLQQGASRKFQRQRGQRAGQFVDRPAILCLQRPGLDGGE